MNLDSYTSGGTKQSTGYKVDKSYIKDAKNYELIKLVYHANLNNHRDNLAITKTRGLIRGGGRKPWRQKGTGHARFGSTRNPIWRSGGIVFGPTGQENYKTKINKKSLMLAKQQALTLQMQQSKVKVISSLDPKDHKTKNFVNILRKLKLEGKILLVDTELSENLLKATANVSNLALSKDLTLSVNKLLDNDHIIITKRAIDAIINRKVQINNV